VFVQTSRSVNWEDKAYPRPCGRGSVFLLRLGFPAQIALDGKMANHYRLCHD